MTELEPFIEFDSANYAESRRYLGEAVNLVQDVVEAYALLAEIVRSSRASGEGVWVGSQFLNSCRRDLIIAVADTMRTRFTDSFFATRRAIEIAAFTAKIAKHPHLLEVWANAADDKDAYDDII